MKPVKEKLNGFHVALLVYMCEVDVTVFSLPHVLAKNIGTNGWVAIFLLSAVFAFNIFLYQILFRVGEGRSAFELLEGVIPKGILAPFYLTLSIFWIALGAVVGKNFILLYQILAFQTTSPEMIFLLFCLIVYALLSKDIYSIVKAITIFFLLTCSMNLLVPFFFDNWSLVRFTTSFFQGTESGQTIHGWLEASLVFVGFEFILFLFPNFERRQKVFKGIYIGHAFFTFALLLVAIVSFGFFSFQEVQALPYPVINTMEYIELPFINRLENLIFTFFLFANIVSTVTFGYMGQVTLKRIVPKLPDKVLVFAIILLVFAVGCFFRILRQTEAWLERGFYIEMALAFAMPIVLIPIAMVLKRKGKAAAHESG
ncbi:GerAB/ArcD/ProY family transporter [Cohnella sp. AR92]|uniref:GerAB/ArcD/ProY family transporter n=1 Tax=Cohnella sp. AR92 TaxID=648716 RepID=UPI000F8D9CFE|nr:GerAB/ArcD/ProY family transporter [Cohnella sp. AR92]RUS44624.1 hypothetical protein ELR57_22845 [Cohnella sp. AR92]